MAVNVELSMATVPWLVSVGCTTTDDGWGVLPLPVAGTTDREPVGSIVTAWSACEPAASTPALLPDTAVSPARCNALFGCMETVVELRSAGPASVSVVGVLLSPRIRRDEDPGARTNDAIFFTVTLPRMVPLSQRSD